MAHLSWMILPCKQIVSSNYGQVHVLENFNRIDTPTHDFLAKGIFGSLLECYKLDTLHCMILKSRKGMIITSW